jgi:hypothetical protein
MVQILLAEELGLNVGRCAGRWFGGETPGGGGHEAEDFDGA